MKKQRAPDLTEERIAIVLEALDGWRGKLTWEALIEAVRSRTGVTYSRFTFAEHGRIASAFGLRKGALRGRPSGPRVPRDERIRAALEQAARYRVKAERLEAENELLLEQFMIWATNAERNGVTMGVLNMPLPKPGRDRTKGED